jgi:activator of 2-hydroxyglutaryl-CoA dehydratase
MGAFGNPNMIQNESWGTSRRRIAAWVVASGEEIVQTTLRMRASVREKLNALIPAGGSVVETIEQMTEYLFAKRMKRVQGPDSQHNAKEFPINERL